MNFDGLYLSTLESICYAPLYAAGRNENALVVGGSVLCSSLFTLALGDSDCVWFFFLASKYLVYKSMVRHSRAPIEGNGEEVYMVRCWEGGY